MAAATGLKKTGITTDGRFRVHDGSGFAFRNSWDEMSQSEQDWFRAKHPDSAAAYGHIPADVKKAINADAEYLSMLATPEENELADLKRQLAALQAQIAAAEVPPATPTAPVVPDRSANAATEQGNRYAGRIRQYEERMAVLAATRDNAAETDDRRGRAASDHEKYQEAIDMLNEAAEIPEEETAWFVSNESDFRVIIPPAIFGSYNKDRDRIESFNMHFHAKDPIHIATLRRAARIASNSIFEKPEGTFPIMDWQMRSFEGWGSWELFAVRDAKRYSIV